MDGDHNFAISSCSEKQEGSVREDEARSVCDSQKSVCDVRLSKNSRRTFLPTTPMDNPINSANTDVTDSKMDKVKDESAAVPMSQNSGQMKKEALMHMIAQEMVASLLGKDDAELEDEAVLEELQKKLVERQRTRKARKKSKKKDSTRIAAKVQELKENPEALADAYYSHVGGEFQVDIKDDDSFAGGDLDGLVDHSDRRRSSIEGRSINDGSSNDGSKKSDSGSRSGRRRSSKIRSKSSQEGSTIVTGSTSGSMSATESSRLGSTEKELSVDEIRQYVVQNIPQAVREQIPEEAWSQIFGLQSNSFSKKSPSVEKQNDESPIGEIVIGGCSEDIDFDDDITTYSEVSGLTSAFPDGKRVEHRRESLSHKPSLPTVDQGKEDGSKDAWSSASDMQSDEEEEKPESTSRLSLGRRSSLMDNSDQFAVAPKKTAVAGSVDDGKRKVRFSEVQVRYYERIVTDNPAVQSGPAIGIGWRFKSAGTVSIEYWENAKSGSRKSAELVLPRHVREHMLREAGFSQKELAEMVRMSLRAKNQRKQTVNNLPAAGFEEAVEKATRGVARLLTFGRKKDMIET
jgi:hypothetical protein